MSLFAELKRRNVFRVALAYGVIAWVLAQVADLAFDNFGAPEWVSKSVLFVLILGFPLAVFFAWAFELTPEGIKKEKDVDRSESITPQTGKRLNFLIISVLVVAVASLLYERTATEAPGQTEEVVATDSSKMSIAVLPFDNRSNRDEDEFFTEGIHDDLLTTMANIGSMKVISRTSVMEYKNTTKKIPEIAKELGVANILEGGIQRSGNQVRINVQLIDAVTDEHLWAEIYDRQLTAENLFTIQSEVSMAIATALQATLSPEEQQRISSVPTESLEAYEKYLLGRQRWAARTADSTAEAVELFLEAIEIDPNYAEAWAGLGDAYRHQVPYGGLPGRDAFPKAEQAIQKALELNPDLAEAHAAYGGLLRQTDGDDDLTLEHLERALELNPSYSPAYNWLGLQQNNEGRFEDALETFRKGIEVDPLSAVLRGNVAFALGFSGHHDEMKAKLERLVESHPEFSLAYLGMGGYHTFVRGRLDDGLVWTLRAVISDPNETSARIMMSRIFTLLGDDAATDQWLQSAFELQPDNLEAQLYEMSLLAMRGEIEQSTASARRLYENYPGSRQADTLHTLLTQADLASGNAESALQRFTDVYPGLVGDDPGRLSIWNCETALDIARALYANAENARADELLGEIITLLQARPTVGLLGSAPILPMAYAVVGREQEALESLRNGVDGGWRFGWRYYLDYHWAFESLRDHADFQLLRIELAADMERQMENLRRMEANGELPVVPGMEPIGKPTKAGPPPT